MFISYLKIALRNFLKHRLYSAINVLGLAAGLTICLLIALYVVDEFGYDTSHPDATRIYRFSQIYTMLDEPLYLDSTMPQTGPLLKENFAEVEDFVRILPRTYILAGANETYNEEELQLVDPSIGNFIAFDWLQGDPATALTEPFTIVLTESFAHRYFGSESALGQNLQMDGGRNQVLRVTGVIADLPYNTHFSGKAFVSMSSAPALEGQDALLDWNNANFVTYLKLQPQAEMTALELEADFGGYLLQSMPDDIAGLDRGGWEFSAIRLPDIHLHSPLIGPGMRSSGNYAKLLILVTIAAGVLLIAAINFINLSTARSLQRSKEITVRKVIGSSRRQLIQQFMGESSMMLAIAFLIALVFAEILLPSLNAFTNKAMTLQTLFASWSSALLTLATVALLAVLAGAYPAFYLSALRPADTMNRKLAGGAQWSLRNLLVIFQFSIAIALVIATLVVDAQVRYGKNIELGFTKDQVLVWETSGTNTNIGIAWSALKSELLRHPEISAATASSIRPFDMFVSERDVRHEGGDSPLALTQIRVDYDFFETYEVDLLAGRTFSETFGGERMVLPTDDNPQGSASFVLNRAAVQMLGWTVEEAPGKWFEMDISNDFSRTVRGPVAGVVEDMHIGSLREAIKPTFYYLPVDSGSLDAISLRLTGNALPETLAFIDATWTKFYPGQPIKRSFLDDEFRSLYDGEERFAQLLSAASALTILISCLGLFGLAAFIVERRTKEIGVRKVMGGSVWSIVLLLTNDFGKLVLISNVIAWPVAYVAMTRWLENFAYRIDLTPLIFIGSGLIALCIAWVTVGGTAAKAASAKPVLALRYE
jgi:putative ABC transport system permease protein